MYKVEFHQLEFPDVLGIASESFRDSRGDLVRIWDGQASTGEFSLKQSTFVYNINRRTLRGMHFQREPFAETKIVLCVTGKIYDVVLDLRTDSPNYGKHFGLELGPGSNFLGIRIPSGFAHGYLTLEPQTSLVYHIDRIHSPTHALGVRWNDPYLNISWPITPDFISKQDQNWPLFINDLNTKTW